MKPDLRLSAGCSTCTEGLQVHRAGQEGARRSRRHGLAALRWALLGSMGRRGQRPCWLGMGRWIPGPRQRRHGRGLRRRGLRLAACCAGPCAHPPVAGKEILALPDSLGKHAVPIAQSDEGNMQNAAQLSMPTMRKTFNNITGGASSTANLQKMKMLWS